jgi:hypothetical protein
MFFCVLVICSQIVGYRLQRTLQSKQGTWVFSIIFFCLSLSKHMYLSELNVASSRFTFFIKCPLPCKELCCSNTNRDHNDIVHISTYILYMYINTYNLPPNKLLLAITSKQLQQQKSGSLIFFFSLLV